MIATSHTRSTRAPASKSARATKRQPARKALPAQAAAPVLVADTSPLPFVSPSLFDRIHPLIDGFAAVDALLAGANALLSCHSPACVRVESVRHAIAQAASVFEDANLRADECAVGKFGKFDSAEDALRVLSLQMNGAASVLTDARDLLEVTDWEESLPLVRVFPLLRIARVQCESLASSLREIRDAVLAGEVIA